MDEQLVMPWGYTPRTDDGCGGFIALSERDVVLLRWLGEQFGARLDVLARLLARHATQPTVAEDRVGDRTARDAVARWRSAGLVATARLEASAPSWVWPTRQGMRLAGLRWRVWQPAPAKLAHVYAVGLVRLELEGRRPEGVWTSERLLRERRDAGSRAHIPDGLFATGPDAEPAAVEVELTPKSQRRVKSIAGELTGRFPAVWYFATPAARRTLETAKQAMPQAAASRMHIRTLPAALNPVVGG